MGGTGRANQESYADSNQGNCYIHNGNVESLSGAKNIETGDAQIHALDPDGSGRDVNLPANASGLWYLIANTADAAEDLTVKDDGGNTVCTVNQNDAALVFQVAGQGWVTLLGNAATDQNV